MPLVRPSALLSQDTLVAVTNSSVPGDPNPIVFFRLNNQTDTHNMSMGDHLTVKNHQMQAYNQPLLLDYINEANHGYIVKGLGMGSNTDFKYNNWIGELDFNTWGYDPYPKKISSAPQNFPQSGFSATVIPKRPKEGRDSIVYIFGGFIKSGAEFKLTNSLLSYNFNSGEWKDYSQSSELSNIPNLAYHTALSVDNRYLVILGGLNSKDNSTYQNLQKMLIFDTKEDKWLPLNVKGNSQCSQKPIVGHTAVEYRGKVIVYGGIDSIDSASSAYSDFCILNPIAWEWNDDKLLDSAGNKYSTGIAWHTSLITNNHMIVLYGSSQNPSSPIMTIDLNTNQVTEAIIFKGSFNLNDGNESKPNTGLLAGVWTLAAVLICLFIGGFYYFIVKKRLRQRSNQNNNNGFGQDNKSRKLFGSFRKNSNHNGDNYNGDTAIWSDDLRTTGSFMTLKNPDTNDNLNEKDEKDEKNDLKTMERLSKFFLEGDTIDEELLMHDEPKFIDLEVGYNMKNETVSSNSTNVDQITSEDTFVTKWKLVGDKVN
ncbi:hypothetical protein CONCODRAFT_9084 [Conidiobolus coronatus NRRL 28638]|uniref:Galactose oxidase n=1 Tax=Conidiobolus coronatus (strain ATCC 28846 / CBS 209.66 / NRRL 28638) TaxID=796925 RepID=A0A137P106_CONC2|nr:hypothetical protein CONCODRAFT_9084 [Conidiobolus coronatus NRRL 28638]|eukprot:KXN68638.1 hypothetical protein CONCODRAFT_9084 [Conidiobolus coronatus NRRL 28638]